MGGDMGRTVIPASLRDNPLYDPVNKAVTRGRDPSLPMLCTYCGVSVGLDGAFKDGHDCMAVPPPGEGPVEEAP